MITYSGFMKVVAALRRHVHWLGDLEVSIVLLLAALLVAFGPWIGVFYLSRGHQPVAAGLLSIIWAGGIVQIVRDFRRQEFSMLTQVVLAVWSLIFVAAIIAVVFILLSE
jgi:hypothetical protein